MSKESKEIYEFGPFRLDVGEHIFERSDGAKNGSLPEKAFQTLVVLVRNQGRLITKGELLDAVWPDAIVEENNLDKAIHAIRHALGETPAEHKYIETVRKHGYRFVADVRKVEHTEDAAERGSAAASNHGRQELVETIENTAMLSAAVPNPQISASGQHALLSLPEWQSLIDRLDNHEEFVTPAAENVNGQKIGDGRVSLEAQSVSRAGNPKRRVFRMAAAAALIVSIGIGGWFAKDGFESSEAPILSAPFYAEKLSTDGKTHHSVISPDGRFVAYMHGDIEDGQSVWLRNLETGHNTEIIGAADELYFGLAFSPDGQLIYFVRRPRGDPNLSAAYRIPITGGIPIKVVDRPQGWISISPDGSRIAFVRCEYSDENFCSLWTADSLNGQNEKMLLARPRPYRIRDIDFSPDGKLVAFSTGQSENMADDFALMAIDIENGRQIELTPERFFNIAGVAWLPDGQALLLTASKANTINSRVWHVDLKSGGTRALTKDTERYRDLSLDASASILISTNIAEKFPTRVMSLDDGKERFTVPDGTTITYAPDGRLFYTSTVSGKHEIWSVDANGYGRRQLTSNPSASGNPVIAKDKSSIYFASNKSGSVHVWRMNADGSNEVQITKEVGGYPIFASPDKEWVYYHHETNRSLWRVSARTGVEQVVVDKKKFCYAMSPNGQQAAFPDRIGTENFVFVVDLATGERVDALKPVDQTGTVVEIAWLPDADGMAYIVSTNDFRKHELWLHRFGQRDTPKKLAEFNKQIGNRGLAISPNGKDIAVSNGDWFHDAVLLRGLK